MSLDNVARIPWLNYIKSSLEGAGRADFFFKPESIVKKDVELISVAFLTSRKLDKEEQELLKPSVRMFLMLKTTPATEPYLMGILSIHERFLLTRFQMNLFHLLLARPKGCSRGQVLAPCGCDGQSPQDLMHFMFLCKFYETPRRHFLVPILKRMNFTQARPVLMYLQLLKEDCIIFIVGYLKSTVKTRACIDV